MLTTTTFTIRPLPADDARTIRAARETHGNPVRYVLDADGGKPCRHCLQAGAAGDGMILASYSPFTKTGPYAEIGPIYIHAQACPSYAERDSFPADFAPKRFVLRKYDAEHNNLGGELIGERSPESVIAQLFSDSKVAYLHARFFGAGCYAFRIDRA